MSRFNPKPCPEPGDGVHNWFMHAAHCAVKAGMTDEQAVEEIWRRAAREPKWNEIEDALSAARGKRRSSTPRWSPADPALIAEVIKGGPTTLDLIASSPQPIGFGKDGHADEIIDALYPGNPWLCVGRTDRNFYTERREFWRGKLSDRSLIVPSPMLAQEGLTQKGKPSFHTLEHTGPRRFVVIESDSGGLDQQAAVIWHLAQRAPLALVAFSGGKSLHSFFFCEGQPEDRVKRFFNGARKLGADSKMWTRSQFARLPDGTRNDGKTSNALQLAGVQGVAQGRQAVIYFNPEVVQ